MIEAETETAETAQMVLTMGSTSTCRDPIHALWLGAQE